jgi:acyl-coenzyme A synthetase/AMP-(fatty) acid ligase
MQICDPLAGHASPRQINPAFRYNQADVAYNVFRSNVHAVATKLFCAGVAPGDVVGVYIGQSPLHWCVLLALLRVGAISVSLSSRVGSEAEALPQMSAVVCARGRRPESTGSYRVIEVSSDWLRPADTEALGMPSTDEAEHRLGRICFTSGTAGTPKAILLDSETLRARLSGTAGRSMLDNNSVLWCGLGPDSAYGYTATLAAWLSGGTVVFTSRLEAAYEQIVWGRVNLVISSPATLGAVLKGYPEEKASRIDGHVIVAGGPLSVAFRDVLLKRFCSKVFVAYGSSEAGGLTLADAAILDHSEGAVGVVFPDVEVQVVGDDGAALPAGSLGRIRVRTGSCVSSYLNDPAATERHFSGGWFYPGDAARLSLRSSLTLVRRDEDVLNIGGVKISAGIVESVIRDQFGINDGAVVALPDATGTPRLVLVAAGQPSEMHRLAPAIRAALPGLPPFRIIPVSKIPRSAMGKFNRVDLAQRVLNLLELRGPDQEGDDFYLLSKPEA